MIDIMLEPLYDMLMQILVFVTIIAMGAYVFKRMASSLIGLAVLLVLLTVMGFQPLNFMKIFLAVLPLGS